MGILLFRQVRPRVSAGSLARTSPVSYKHTPYSIFKERLAPWSNHSDYLAARRQETRRRKYYSTSARASLPSPSAKDSLLPTVRLSSLPHFLRRVKAFLLRLRRLVSASSSALLSKRKRSDTIPCSVPIVNNFFSEVVAGWLAPDNLTGPPEGTPQQEGIRARMGRSGCIT